MQSVIVGLTGMIRFWRERCFPEASHSSPGAFLSWRANVVADAVVNLTVPGGYL